MTDKNTAPKKSASTWSDAQVKQLETAYTGSECNASLDNMIAGKTAAAVRSKLVSLGLYEKADPTAKAAASVASRKPSIVKAIEILVGVKTGELETLEKASKPQLEALAAALTKLSDRSNADQGLKDPQPTDASEEISAE
jgi:hypothetical protein